MSNRTQRSLRERLMPWFKNKGEQPKSVVPMSGDQHLVTNRADRRALGYRGHAVGHSCACATGVHVPRTVRTLRSVRRAAAIARHPAGKAIGR